MYEFLYTEKTTRIFVFTPKADQSASKKAKKEAVAALNNAESEEKNKTGKQQKEKSPAIVE